MKTKLNIGDLLVYGNQYVIYITDLIYTLDEETDKIEYKYLKIPPDSSIVISTIKKSALIPIQNEVATRSAKHYPVIQENK
jgi:hypothetical protein